MRVVAEGVETDREAAMLKDLDCDELQGYLIAKPMPAGDVNGFLERSGVSPAAPRLLRVRA
jgi:EAL domain-containing protein (putative c-di-GMP-specific phosphodiesterase class I)